MVLLSIVIISISLNCWKIVINILSFSIDVDCEICCLKAGVYLVTYYQNSTNKAQRYVHHAVGHLDRRKSG